MTIALTSTPTSPASIVRTIDGYTFTLKSGELELASESDGPIINLDTEAAFALATFIKTPGVYRLLTRLWLNEQHAANISE